MQAHSEMNDEILRELLENRREKGIFAQELYEDAMRRLYKNHDGIVIVKAFLKFCLK